MQVTKQKVSMATKDDSWFKHYTLFYKNIFYENVEAEICEILRIF